MPVPPQEYTPSLSHSPSTSSPPFSGFNNRPDQEFSELCSCYWTPSRRTHFLNTLSHLERVSHRPDNLLLLSTGLTTHFFTPAPQHTSMVMETTETGRGNGNDGTIHRKPAGYRCNKGINSGLLQRFKWLGNFNNGIPGFPCACWVHWCKMEKGSKNSKNSHLYLHVPGMTHGAHEACSSPLGVRSLFPKELRISGFISQLYYFQEIHYNIPLG
jgi:hypothetical protein